MTTKDEDLNLEEKTDKSRNKKAIKPKKSEKRPYSGTHGYTEEEVNEIVKKQRRERK